MTILVDIVHPADVHFFKHAIREWERRGHKVVVTARDKEMTLKLLKSYEQLSTASVIKVKGFMGFSQGACGKGFSSLPYCSEGSTRCSHWVFWDIGRSHSVVAGKTLYCLLRHRIRTTFECTDLSLGDRCLHPHVL